MFWGCQVFLRPSFLCLFIWLQNFPSLFSHSLEMGCCSNKFWTCSPPPEALRCRTCCSSRIYGVWSVWRCPSLYFHCEFWFEVTCKFAKSFATGCSKAWGCGIKRWCTKSRDLTKKQPEWACLEVCSGRVFCYRLRSSDRRWDHRRRKWQYEHIRAQLKWDWIFQALRRCCCAEPGWNTSQARREIDNKLLSGYR